MCDIFFYGPEFNETNMNTSDQILYLQHYIHKACNKSGIGVYTTFKLLYIGFAYVF